MKSRKCCGIPTSGRRARERRTAVVRPPHRTALRPLVGADPAAPRRTSGRPRHFGAVGSFGRRIGWRIRVALGSFRPVGSAQDGQGGPGGPGGPSGPDGAGSGPRQGPRPGPGGGRPRASPSSPPRSSSPSRWSSSSPVRTAGPRARVAARSSSRPRASRVPTRSPSRPRRTAPLPPVTPSPTETAESGNVTRGVEGSAPGLYGGTRKVARLRRREAFVARRPRPRTGVRLGPGPPRSGVRPAVI